MKFHAFMYVTIGRRRELERGMAGKDPVLYQRMLDEIGEYARLCDEAGWCWHRHPRASPANRRVRAGPGPRPDGHVPGHARPRLRINQFGYVLPTHNPLRVAEHAATLDHLLGGRLNVAFVRGYQARWFENYAAVPGVEGHGAVEPQDRPRMREPRAVRGMRGHHQDSVDARHLFLSRASTGLSRWKARDKPHEHPVYAQVWPGRRPRWHHPRGGHRAPAAAEPDPRVFRLHAQPADLALLGAGRRQAHRDGQRDGLLRDALGQYREVAEEHGRHMPGGEEAAWGGYLVLADTKSEAEAWARGLPVDLGLRGRCPLARAVHRSSSAMPTPSRA